MSKTQKNILMTGGTGAFGRFLAREILKDETINLTLLVRASSEDEARDRIRSIVGIDRERVVTIKADLAIKNLGLSENDYNKLLKETDYLIHSAASTRFNLSLEKAWQANVLTTKNIIEFTTHCSKLARFGYLSTAFVAGKCTGVIKEDDLEHGCGFSNSYQQTKYEAESSVRKNMTKIPTVIFRPSFIIPSNSASNSSEQSVDFLSVLISLVARGQLPCVPGSGEGTMDLVSSYDVANTIIKLLFKEKLSHAIYHITNGSRAIDLKTFHQMVEESVGRHIPIEYCGNIDSFKKRLKEVSKVRPEIVDIYKKGGSFLLEPAYPKCFDNSYTLSELGISGLGEDPVETLRSVLKSRPWNS